MTVIGHQIWQSPNSDSMTPDTVWVDLETTGLDAQMDSVLEVGAIVLDKDWNEITAFQSLVIPMPLGFLESRINENDFVKEMHTKNGLLDELRELQDLAGGANYRAPVVDMRFREFLDGVGQAKKFEMCGSTIFFDRAFLNEDMQQSHDWFHYRNVDVTSIWNLARRWAPEIYEAMPREDEKKHRVLDDIRESIGYLKFLKEHFLIGRNV